MKGLGSGEGGNPGLITDDHLVDPVSEETVFNHPNRVNEIFSQGQRVG